MKRTFLANIILLTFSALTVKAQHAAPFIPDPQDTDCRQWVENTLSKMNMKDKVSQLFVYTLDPADNSKSRKELQNIIKKYKPGGLLFSDGTIEGQAALTNVAQSVSNIPLMITFDGEWGLAMRLEDTPEFPRNSAIGCIEDNNLIEAYGREVARQLKEMGVHVNFAPVVDVNVNPKNPVIHVRSYGKNPKTVSEKAIAYSRGLETGGILSVSKHFPGHGDTDTDSHLLAPIIPYPRAHLDTVELYPFREIINAGMGGIMVGHLKVPDLEPDRQLVSSLSHNIVTGLLKEEMGFKGLIFTDALEMKGVCDIPDMNVKALKAGNDMLLIKSDRIDEARESILAAIKRGELSEQEINDKCRKVLQYKYIMGLNNKPQPISIPMLNKRIHTEETDELINKLQTSGVTVLGNYGNVIPLSPSSGNIAVLTIGEKDADKEFINTLKKYITVEHYQVNPKTSREEMEQIISKLPKFHRIIINITGKDTEVENYKEFLTKIDIPSTPIIYTFFTSYRAVESILPAIRKSSAVVLAHSGEENVQRYVADVLFANAYANGRLSMDLGDVFPAGTGIDINIGMATSIVPEDIGFKSYILHREIDSIINVGLKAKAFPGCQALIMKDGVPVYDKSFGTHSYKNPSPTKSTDLYDLAEVTETSATLLAIMKLFDDGKIRLNDKASEYLPFLRATNKRNITIRELLFHESGLPPFMRFYRELIDDKSFQGPFTQGFVDEWHYTRIGEYTYACSTFKFKQGLISPASTPDHTLQMAEYMWLNKNFKTYMMLMISGAEMDKKRYVYSYTGSILLQQIVEAITKMPMNEYLEKEFYGPMGLERTKFNPLRYFGKEEIIPTAENDFLRRQDLHGYVHDETASCLGGVSGNAGLFSTAHELAQIYQMLLNEGESNGKRYLSELTCKLFTTEKSNISRRGLGFDKPDVINPLASPTAPSVPGETYGSVGRTGTSVWVDPQNNIVFIFLSNRVCPNAWNDTILRMNITNGIQETIYKSIR